MSRTEGTRRWLIAQLDRIGVDAPVFFSVIARAWQLLTGPVTVTLMALCFTPEMRGYFYTFGSVLALQVFFELSLHIVLINVTSHEWARLSINENGEMAGDEVSQSRLASLLGTSLRWYAVAAFLFVILCGPGGAVFLARGSLPLYDWILPWSVLVLLTGGLLAVQPMTAILEGCDQLKVVNQYRFRQAVFGTLVVWSIIVSGLGLWAAAGSAAVRLGWELHLVRIRYRPFFRSFGKKSVSTSVDWSLEVFPLLWRLGIQGIATWWALQTLTPVIFEFHGDVEGGRMGMTWTVLIALQSATASWVDTRRPKFGQLIATGRIEELNSLFIRCLSISIVLLALGCAVFCGVLVILPQIEWGIAQKLSAAFIGPDEAAILALGILLFQIPAAQSIYVRAFKVEPFLVPSLVVCSMFAMTVFYFGKSHGVIGAATAWSCVVGVIQVPVWSVIWMKIRHRGLKKSL
ncbi:MAG: hypothetical protein ISQ06_09670 [Planctomycetaceae bacterium]|nr:hypothetical protein [Planctomycetaceae bacterium]